MQNTHRVRLSVLMSITVLIGIVSLFLPFLVKLNVKNGDLAFPKILLGYDYGLTVLILFIMAATIISIVSIRNQIVSVVLSLLVVTLVGLVRYSIHFQGFVDHGYDSKTGMGFFLLFIATLAHVIISLCALLLQIRNRKTNTAHGT